MSKTACKKKNFSDKKNPGYECKRCGALVRKEEKVCKPRKIDND
jgi:DNA-directed RNA polymerase subunit RPC12/RpoP